MHNAVVIFLLAFADAYDEDVEQSGDCSTRPPLAFAFGPGGLLGPYYLGVAFQLRDLGLIQPSTPIGGASAGAVAAAALAFGKEESEVVDVMVQFMEEVKQGDSLKRAFRRVLEAMVPEDAAELAEQHNLAIGYYEVLPRMRPHIVTSWKSKDDFIETILASMNFPFYFSKLPFVKCRGSWAVDGLWSVDRERCGCPPLDGDRNVAVVAMPDKQRTAAFPSSDIIQPGQKGMELPVSAKTWRQWMLSPAPNENIHEMIALGRAHARTWALEQCIVPAFESLPYCRVETPTVELPKINRLQPQLPSRPQLPIRPRKRDQLLQRLGMQWPRPLRPLARPGAPKLLAQMSDEVISNVLICLFVAIISLGGIICAMLRLCCGNSTVGKEPLLIS